MNLFSRTVSVTDSSNISEIAFDPGDNVMRVKFITGGAYLYEDVSARQFGEIVSSDSVGSEFSRLRAIWVWPTTKVVE